MPDEDRGRYPGWRRDQDIKGHRAAPVATAAFSGSYDFGGFQH